jgi:hypothetical protein
MNTGKKKTKLAKTTTTNKLIHLRAYPADKNLLNE